MNMGEKIWTVLGWDSPEDFIKDAVLLVATGSAGKFLRWSEKLYKINKRVSVYKKRFERFKKLKARLEIVEQEAKRIADTAKIIGAIRDASRLKDLLVKLLNTLTSEKKDREVKLLLGSTYAKNMFRSTFTSATAEFVEGKSPSIVSTATKEITIPVIEKYLEQFQPFSKIPNLEKEIKRNYILLQRVTEREEEMLTEYLFLLFASSFLARMFISSWQKSTVTEEMITSNIFEAIGSAVEKAVLDHPLAPKWFAKEISLYVIKLAREILTVLVKKLSTIIYRSLYKASGYK
jgi:hypothetical protein